MDAEQKAVKPKKQTKQQRIDEREASVDHLNQALRASNEAAFKLRENIADLQRKIQALETRDRNHQSTIESYKSLCARLDILAASQGTRADTLEMALRILQKAEKDPARANEALNPQIPSAPSYPEQVVNTKSPWSDVLDAARYVYSLVPHHR